MGVVLASSLVSGAAFADVAYTAGAPAVQVQGVQSLDVQAKVKKGWKSTAAGKAYYRNGSPVVGPQKIGGAYYYFNSKGILRQTDVKVADAVFYVGKGGKIFGAKRNGQCYYGTLKAMTSSDAFDFETFIWARSIVASISSSSDSDSAKLWKAFNWVKNKSYAIHQNFDPRQTNWPAIYARHHFNNSGGDCHADGAAFAYLAAAIGYPADVCIDSWGTGYAPSHCWAMIGNAVYDPLFYESKSTMYYGATSGTYETSPTARFRVPQYNPSNNSGGEVSQALLNAGALGLKKVNGAYCYYVNGKKVKSTWKTIDGKRYYFKKNGAAATLSTKVDGAYYVFDKKGVLQRSAKAGERIVTIGKESYQVHKSGKAAAGWSKGKKRYAKSNGLILKKTWKNIDGKRYYFAKDGVRVTRSAKVEGSYYVFDVDGALLKGEKGSPTALVEVGKNTYRVDSEGKAVAGWSAADTGCCQRPVLVHAGS